MSVIRKKMKVVLRFDVWVNGEIKHSADVHVPIFYNNFNWMIYLNEDYYDVPTRSWYYDET